MNRQMLEKLYELYALGTPLGAPQRVTGGLLHHMYRIRTTHGDFAVKVLNPTVMGYADVRAKFRLSERIAAAVSAAQLPVIGAIESCGDVIHDVGSATVMLFPWIDGFTLSASSTEPAHAHQIGSILGRIHGLRLHFAELHAPLPAPDFVEEPSEAADWIMLLDKGEQQQSVWAAQVRELLPEILLWKSLSEKAKQLLPDRWVISHGDLDQKNVLWFDNHTPWLIDWECAGYVQPAIEAVGAALDWSGQAEGHPNAATFEAFLQGYRRETPLAAKQVRCGLQAYMGNWCGWLKFNMQRSLGLVTADAAEQLLGTREISKTLMLLDVARAHLPALEQQFGIE